MVLVEVSLTLVEMQISQGKYIPDSVQLEQVVLCLSRCTKLKAAAGTVMNFALVEEEVCPCKLTSSSIEIVVEGGCGATTSYAPPPSLETNPEKK